MQGVLPPDTPQKDALIQKSEKEENEVIGVKSPFTKHLNS